LLAPVVQYYFAFDVNTLVNIATVAIIAIQTVLVVVLTFTFFVHAIFLPELVL
jgi:hypothetical protein